MMKRSVFRVWPILLAVLSLSGPLAFGQDESAASIILKQFGDTAVFIYVIGNTSSGAEFQEKGTGYIVSENGYVLTSAHLFTDGNMNPYAKIRARSSIGTNFDPEFPTGIILPLQVLKIDVTTDAALLKLPEGKEHYNWVNICRDPNTNVGARIHTLGYPLGDPLAVNSGTLSSKDGPQGLWRTDIAVTDGNSGGPVFDDTGRVIAMVKGGIPDAPGNNFVLPSNLFVHLLESGLANLDTCRNGSLELIGEGRNCETKVVDFDVEFTKADHPSYTSQKGEYTQSFSALPGHTIESASWIVASSNHAETPRLEISEDKLVVRFSTNIESGPFFDKWRGWISGKIVTTQKPDCK